jgi:hypothetical protein
MNNPELRKRVIRHIQDAVAHMFGLNVDELSKRERPPCSCDATAFKLEVLTIEGLVNFGGLTFGPDSIRDPFEDSFLRRMLENWAILASEYVDHLDPVNIPGTPHALQDLLKQVNKKSSKKNKSVSAARQSPRRRPAEP